MKIAFGIAAALVLAGTGTASAAPFALTSTAFKNNGTIEQKNAGNIMGCTGDYKSPALEWKNPPAGTKSFVLMVHDPDAPTGSGFWHWVVYNIPGTATSIAQGLKPGDLPDGSHQAKGQRDIQGYRAPCAPAGVGRLHYLFNLFALDSMLNLPAGATEADIKKAMDGHILGSSINVAAFEKQP